MAETPDRLDLSKIAASFPPIHRAGYMFIAIFAIVALVLFVVWQPLGWLGLIATGWCAFFFRDPPRHVPARKGLILAPADGRIQAIERAEPPEELELDDDEARMRVSIFLDVFDVHINRLPVTGEVVKRAYHPGKKLNAALDKASVDNERNSLLLRREEGEEVIVTQIAGLVARRIVCEIEEGDDGRGGDRFGMIRFGSRVDLYLPEGAAPLVAVGQRMVAGETVIADLKSREPQRRARRV